jgi:leader peptidase (prepilin peptidase) / N-methyltransferase
LWKTSASVEVFLYSDQMTVTDYFAWLGPIYLLSVAWPLSVIDIRERRLPNRLTLPAFPITLIGQTIALIGGAELWRLLVALLGSVLAFAGCLALNRYAGLGMGDVKLISAITLALSWFSPLLPALAILIALTLAGVVALVLVCTRKTNMGSSIALGPYLLVGFALSFIGLGWS